MMKSVFLSDSNVLELPDSSDGDYIMVNNLHDGPSALEELMEDNEDDNDNLSSCSKDNHSYLDIDEEDYDYCDDIVLSDGEQSQQGCYHLSVSLTEDMILEEAQQPSLRNVLDEAHRSASKLGLGSSICTTGEDEQSVGPEAEDDNEEDDDDDDMHSPGRLESSASDASVPSTADAPHNPKTTAVTAPLLPKPKRTDEKESGKSPTCASALVSQIGRISNKKRRKKMKQLKKEAAAAKAAAALSMTTESSSKDVDKKHKKLFKTSTVSRPHHGKRVANIAVACAAETLASYKAEVAKSTKKAY